jgi:chaperonin GroES
MTIRPLQGQVLLYMDAPEIQSNGVHIPEMAQERSQIGEVRKLGIWKQNKRGSLIAYEVQPGDKVLVNARSGRWLHGERERLKLVPASQLLAIVSSNEAERKYGTD